jgi:hypothetical protein
VTAEALAVAAACGISAAAAEPLYVPVVSATRGVWRVGSSVVKVLQPVAGTGPWAASLDPGDPYWWRREVSFYESAPDVGLRVPECYGVVPLPDGALGLCLEDVSALVGEWAVESYVRVARASARMAGTPAEPWMSRGWLPAYCARRGMPYDLAGLPDVVAHLDLSEKNVLVAGDPPAAIDWAYAGTAPVGTDVGGFAMESVLDFHLPYDALDEVEAAMHDAYVASVGMPEDVVRRGLRETAATRFAWVPAAAEAADRDRRPTLNGRPLDEALPVWRAVSRRLRG